MEDPRFERGAGLTFISGPARGRTVALASLDDRIAPASIRTSPVRIRAASLPQSIQRSYKKSNIQIASQTYLLGGYRNYDPAIVAVAISGLIAVSLLTTAIILACTAA